MLYNLLFALYLVLVYSFLLFNDMGVSSHPKLCKRKNNQDNGKGKFVIKTLKEINEKFEKIVAVLILDRKSVV